MTTFESGPSGGVRGRLRVPGDKSISHRALLLAAIAEGRSRVTGLSTGEDVVATGRAIEQFGAGVERDGPSTTIEGGRERLHEPVLPIDVGNSGTGIRLLAGWAAAIEGLTVLSGDASIAQRPMDRVVTPLRAMGARVDGRDDGRYPPLTVRGGSLRGIDYELPVASAQVKGAVLLAGLAAEGATTVREATPTRRHTEEMLARYGADISTGPGSVTVKPGRLEPFRLTVPGDPSQAAFWIVAACITPGSDLVIEDVYIGPGRAGFLDVLGRMGADVEVLVKEESAATATLRARHSPLKGTEVGGIEVPSLIDEIPVLAVAAAYADGETTFSDAAELKFKESDRIATTVAALGAIGARAEGREDGLVVQGGGGQPLLGGPVDSAGDHRVAMALAVAGLASSHGVAVTGWESVSTSYPAFEEDYRLSAL